MVKRFGRRIGGVVVVASVLVTIAAVAAGAADAPAVSTIYVDGSSAACTDSGAGAADQPFCTVSAAASVAGAGQTVLIKPGDYNESLTITHSGEPGAPITFETTASSYYVRLTGPGGLIVSGQHDIAISNFEVAGSAGGPDVVLSDSSDLSLTRVMAIAKGASTGFSLVGLTDSTITTAAASNMSGAGFVLDAQTSGVRLTQPIVPASQQATGSGAAGIDVFGSSDVIADAQVTSSAGAGIAVEAGAHDNVIADNLVKMSRSGGILNAGGAGTAITNNTVLLNCGVGIAVTGASTGVSVQNNVSTHPATPSSTCDPANVDSADIGVYGAAVSDTVVDYNTVDNLGSSSPAYAWGSPVTDVVAFRAVSGQGAHDLQADPASGTRPDVDSANSAAPGVQSVDGNGRFIEDDPDVANTGVGPITYLDRGAAQLTGGPTPTLIVVPSNGGRTVTVSAFVVSWAPAKIVNVTLNFGDGTATVTYAGSAVSHTFAVPGVYSVGANAADNNNVSGGIYEFYTWTAGTAITSAGSASTVLSGHTVTLSTKLTRTDTGQTLSARPVSLQFEAAGTSTWSTVATATTSSTGTASATVKPSGSGYYRWTYAGVTGYAAATSSSTHVLVTVSVAVKLSATSIHYGTTTKVTATATPHESGVTLYLQRYEGSKGWVTIATGKESSSGVATWSVKLPRGTQSLRVVKAASTRYTTSVSATVKVTVK